MWRIAALDEDSNTKLLDFSKFWTLTDPVVVVGFFIGVIVYVRFRFVLEDLVFNALSYVLNLGGTSGLSKRKKRLDF